MYRITIPQESISGRNLMKPVECDVFSVKAEGDKWQMDNVVMMAKQTSNFYILRSMMKEQLSLLMSRLLCTEQRSKNHLLWDLNVSLDDNQSL